MDIETLRKVITIINTQLIANENTLKYIPSSAGSARHAIEGVETGAVMAVENLLDALNHGEREFAMADSYRLRMAVDKKYHMKAESPVLQEERARPRKQTRLNGKDATA